MDALRRLFRVGSMADSMGFYLPANAIAKAIGLARLLILVHLMSQAQYNLWAAGAMIFDFTAPILTLGSSHGLARYVSVYEARGQLREFYRRLRWGLLGVCLVLTAGAIAASDAIRGLAIASEDSSIGYRGQILACWAAIGNAALTALYMNLIAFLYGLRAYRLVSVIELAFAVVFLAAGTVLMAGNPDGVVLLTSHAVCLAAVLVGAVAVLEIAFRRGLVAAVPAREAQVVAPAVIASREIAADLPAGEAASSGGELSETPRRTLYKVLAFGAASLVGTMLWNLGGYLSYRLTSYQDELAGAKFQAFLRLDQQVIFLASAAWAVVFSHVARLYEDDRPGAMRSLDLSFKAVSLATITMGMLVYLTSPLWVYVLPAKYHDGLMLVGPLLMFFQTLSNLSLTSILTRLHNRPGVMAVVALAGVGLNWALATWWMPVAGSFGAALAAGVGMYAGGWVITLWYVHKTGVRLSGPVWAVFATPIIFLLPAWGTVAAWAAIMIVSALTPWMFSNEEKLKLRGVVSQWRAAWGRRKRNP